MKRTFLTIWILFALSSAFYADASTYDVRNNDVEFSDSCDGTEDQKSDQQECAIRIDKTFSTTFHLDFHADLSFEFEFPLVLDNGLNDLYNISIENTEYFKTLFHYIISPNAP